VLEKKTFRFATLRAYVDAQPRSVTQGSIAETLGLTDSGLSQYLRGHCRPSADVALRLSREFDISLEGLLDPEAIAS
jgi:transcriptional regulator with XRE-family HTH domain